MTEQTAPAQRKKLAPGLKLALEMGPLVLFFLAYSRFGIFEGTAVLMVSTVVALAITYAMTRHLPVMPVVTAVMVMIFGGLTLVLHDATFVKMKATIVYLLFAAALLGGLAFGKALLSVVFDTVMKLTEEGWRKLTLRWGLFFLAMAAVNEIVWRTQSEDFWVKFKVFGFVPLTVLFALSQTPLMLKYELKGEDAEKAPEHL
ncbi:MAG: septation protein A [Hyphomicrobiales bacterium]|nr:septation protein A [Hyphomicrobiales bacterium]